MEILVKIGGTSRAITARDGAFIRTSMSSRNTAAVNVLSVDGSYVPRPGDTISIEDDTPTVWFAGTVDSVETTWRAAGAQLRHSVTAVGYDQIAARRVCWESRHWENTAAGDIFKALVTAFLGGENVDVGEVIDGPSIAVFDAQGGATVYAVFDALAEAAGLYWDMVGVVGNPVARLYERGTYASGTSLLEAHVMLPNGSVMARADRRDLANRIWVRTRAGAGPMTSETFAGDGATREFTVSQTIAGWPLVTVNDAGQTVQIRDGGEAGQWYFTPGSAIISQDAGETVLEATDAIVVDYPPQIEAIEMLAESTADISARDTQEATSGKYEILIEAVDAASAQAGQEKADAELARRTPATAGGPLNRRVTITTRVSNDFEAGQTLTLPPEVRTPFGLPSGPYLIEECTRSASPAAGGSEWRVTIEATFAKPSGDWRSQLASALGGSSGGAGGSGVAIAAAASTSNGASYVS